MIETTKDVVREILRTIPQTRSDDLLLCLNVYAYLGHAKKLPLGIMIRYENIEDAPAFETITRIRREIQHEDKEFEATPEVQERRRRSEEEYKVKYAKSSTYTTAQNSQLSW